MSGRTSRTRLALSQVTLCAASSVNLAATVHALQASLAQIEFADCLLFTDQPTKVDHPAIRIVQIERLTSAEAYSEFLLAQLPNFIETSHCLIVQWDGHVRDAHYWDPQFLDYDFIGASWPQFFDGYDVGNGGFSLRSKSLLEACKSRRFQPAHPEDISIGRTHRAWLEAQGLRFAGRALADCFSAERAGNLQNAFGYHGVWHMPEVLGTERFWDIYRTLDDRSTIRHDLGPLLRQICQGENRTGRVVRMVFDQLGDALKRRI